MERKQLWILALVGWFLAASLLGRWGGGGIGLIALLIALILGVLCIVVSMSQVFRMKRPFAVSRFAISLLPLFGVSTILLGLDVLVVDEFRGKPVFNGTCEHTVTFVHLVLRDDGSCEYEPGSFLDRNWQKGTWTRSGELVHVQLLERGSANSFQMKLRIQEDGLHETKSPSADESMHLHGFRGLTGELKI